MSLLTQFASEVACAGLPAAPPAEVVVTASEVAALPEPARRYLRFMGAIGHPRDWSFRLHCTGRFRPALDEEWRPAESWQYNSGLDVARIYHMRLQFYGIPVVGRDVYLHGAGHLVIRPLDLVTVEHDRGTAFDEAELVTWLNDAVLFAPSMLLRPGVEWAVMGTDTFGLTLSDSGHTVSARVTVDARGAPLDFETASRVLRDPANHRIRRARWSTPIPGWQVTGRRCLPTGARAVWHLPGGEFAYAELTIRPGDIAYNVAPDSIS